ncbi:sensor histidine kinase [Streptomyces pratensis]|uniref:sensor histidine kinase n=1 Tax=Streptomyces pratensis TaxID=1169025 RepID=UPI00362E3098
MSPHRAATAADRARGTASPQFPGLEAVWGQNPILNVLLSRRRRLRRLDRRRPWLLDSSVVLLVVCVSLPDLLAGGATSPFGETDTRAPLPTAVLCGLFAAQVVPLWWRRRAPAAVCLAVVAVSVVQGALGLSLPAAISAALYTLALHGSLRLLGWALAAAVFQVVLTLCVLVPVERWVPGLFFLMGAVIAPTAVGLALRAQRMYLTALRDRDQRLAIERDQRVQLTAAAERSRVAREMHDIVGHNLSVMVTLADGAATLAANNDERSAEALRMLGDTGRQAMSELRSVLGVLREGQQDHEGRPLSPQPGIGDVEALLTRVRAAGLPVTYRTAGDLAALGSGVQLTVYRIVQEALTNTLKHVGAGSATHVTVAADARRVRIRVADTGSIPGAPVHAEPSVLPDDLGHGLVGIRQRAALYGGAVKVGPRDDGPGWIVDVELDVPTTRASRDTGESPS